ncbi:MAG: hypothetical protein Q7K57_53080 [Burkholderiaceae bacterium]|nr:hypothetical protein [Burkholderiaceae bacterium]
MVLLTLIGGILGYALASGSDAIENSAKAWDWWKVDRTFTGRWTNDTEGHLDPPIDVRNASGSRVELALHVENGNASGDIHSEQLCEFNPHAYVFIEGRRLWWGWGGIRARAWDYRDGKRVAFADLIITHDGSTGNLEIRTAEPSPFFPEHVRLFRSSKEAASVSDKFEPICPQFIEAVKNARSAASAAGASGPRERRPVAELTTRGDAPIRENSRIKRAPGADAGSPSTTPKP